MSIKIKARITRELFHRDDYYILAATPTESNRDIKLNQYGGFTLVGNLGFLTVDNEYELIVKEGKAPVGMYEVLSADPNHQVGDKVTVYIRNRKVWAQTA